MQTHIFRFCVNSLKKSLSPLPVLKIIFFSGSYKCMREAQTQNFMVFFSKLGKINDWLKSIKKNLNLLMSNFTLSPKSSKIIPPPGAGGGSGF